MSYSVEWTDDALDQLAGIWNAATDRKSITTASHTLDTALKHDPMILGESRNSSVNRTTYQSPLGIEFEIIEDDKKVRVVRAWSIA